MSHSEHQRRYDELRALGLKLDMTRGKPCAAQLDLSQGLLTAVTGDVRAADGTDCRNYGGVDGLPEAKALFADMAGVAPSEVIVGGSSSLTLMYDSVVRCLLHAPVGGDKPWRALPKVRWACPVPGYDRHFAVCENLGIEMTTVPMTDDGPDMDALEPLVAADASVRGMWLVPRFSNPTGAVVSPEVVQRLAGMRTAAPDFRIFWDDAYAVHVLGNEPVEIPSILEACKQAGNPDRVFLFGSTSKITFAGAGVAFMAGSEANMAWTRKHLGIQTIGPDKLNQLRHLRFLGDLAGIRAHMQRHAAILRPKFERVLSVLEEELGGSGLATWTTPRGGYFVTMWVPKGTASRVVQLAKEAGVALTPAGATHPYGKDPDDRVLRLAPSFPTVEEIDQAMRVVAACVRLAAAG
jgi:DNA-binding transcriptional MocR family regulator